VQWWLLTDDNEPLFSCWVFHARLPAVAARDGWVPLPAGIAAVEDSVTAPAARGRGIGPAAWCAVATRLAETGDIWLIRKAALSNGPAIRAGHKAGFADIAEVHYTRRGPSRRVEVRPAAGAANATWLADRLATSRPVA
jgi:GNAT superfamily N-acetyltransferase